MFTALVASIHKTEPPGDQVLEVLAACCLPQLLGQLQQMKNKRPKMGLYRSPDIHWCHGQEYELEDLVKKLDNSVLQAFTKILPSDLLFDPTLPYFYLSVILSI